MKRLVLGVGILLAAAQAQAAVTLLDKDQWKLSMGGFVEFDTIADSVRSFTETIGNAPVDRPDALAGSTGRTQFSIRNTRLSFNVEAPQVDGWKTKGYFEFDLMGFDPAPGASNTEAAFFNNPTLRVRHAYLSGEANDWQIMAGQYWAMFGWQPYFFMPTVQVAPLPGMLYSRTSQIRVVKSMAHDDCLLQAALGVMRPPQRDATLPGLEGGLRYAMGKRTAGFTGGSTGPQKAQPMSVGISGAVRRFEIPQSNTTPTGDKTYFTGKALAVDGLFPVIASKDGKDVSNTLAVGGEYTRGTGYGDQFGSWSGNQASPMNTAATAPDKNVNMDAGIGGFDPSGQFYLVNLTTFNAHFQYHLPAETHTWFSGGYGRVYSDNVDRLVNAAGKTNAGKIPYNKEQVYFANVFHDLTSQVRVGFEYAHVRTTYEDVMAHDNRYQLSAWFIF